MSSGSERAAPTPAARLTGRLSGWLRESTGGLFSLALVIGCGAGLGAVAFRYLIAGLTWLFTGHAAFGQQGYAGSAHLPRLGLAFFLVIPVAGGLAYGPLIYRWAREARGHGVPEVMIAVADDGGRIRPQVSIVKALASALCIGTGGSVGREGPIVQIGSALASGLGQRVRMPESRMRILVACGAAGGIAATFNAPITGVFFGVEIILRAFSVEALVTVMVSAMVADVAGEAFLGSGPFLSGFPAGIALHHPRNYLLVAALAVVAALLGLGFKTVLYRTEDLCDRVWANRPEWARPAVGGVALGLLLLALPQMYGVGYPVMYKALAGGYVLWFLLVLAVGKMIATSLTIGIGGSGGVFAPSLFIGATSGMAFGEIADHVLGPGAGQPALYAAVAMGAVFAAAARAPLTSLASVVEMTGDFTLTLPVMLAVAVATAVSRAASYGTIYTAKLLRRGTDIDRPAPWNALQALKVADVMHPLPVPVAVSPAPGSAPGGLVLDPPALPGPVTTLGHPQPLFTSESLDQALRQLTIYGHDGLPVLSADGSHVDGWVTGADVVGAVAREIRSARSQARHDGLAASWAGHDPRTAAREQASSPAGYQVLEVTIQPGSHAAGTALGTVTWPPGCIPVAVRHGGRPRSPDPGLTLSPGDRIILLAASARDNNAHDPGHGLQGGSDCQPGLLAAQLFYNLNMCAASSDLTAMALIRQAAMRLFAERGVAEVTIREIAAEAGVSPSLVIHHFGSKGGLKAAADDRATALVDKLVSDLASGVSASSLAGVFAERFEQEPVLLTYLRRLLVDGGPAAEAMFRGLFDATVAGLGQLEAAGLVSPSADHRLRAAFLLVNDLAVVLLRDQVRAVLGIDPLSRDGMANWTAEVLQIYTRGVFTAAEPAPPAAGASGEEPS